MTIVLWNTRWRPHASYAGSLIRERIFAAEPDIVCVTEAQQDVLDSASSITSCADYGFGLTKRRMVVLWSKTGWAKPDHQVGQGLPKKGRFISGVTASPIGVVQVTGVCVPCDRATGGQTTAPRAWELHNAFLERDAKKWEPVFRINPALNT